MGWASGTNYEGRAIGYSRSSTCEHEDCNEKINLGLAYCCGGLDGVNGLMGCGHYFCYEHLFFSASMDPGPLWRGNRCKVCADRITNGETEPLNE